MYKPPMMPHASKGLDMPSAAPSAAPSNPPQRHGDNPVITNARAGPRIFVGKLTKDTTEADVKEYFSRCVKGSGLGADLGFGWLCVE